MNAMLRFRDHIKLLRNIRTTGTITPSSKNLIDQLLRTIDFEKARCIVELGPGNGCITRRLLQKMHADCVLICLEVNSEFVAELNAFSEPRMKVYKACASSIGEILDELNIDMVDHVVSSLPLALIEKDVVSTILESVSQNLRDGGHFLQYQYTLKNYDDIKPVFSSSHVRFTMRNMPPAFIYECTK